MKRCFILLAAILFGTASLSAQYKDITYDNPENCKYKLIQIDQYDEGSTVFFFTITSDGSHERFNINDNTSIAIDGTY